MCCHVFRCKRKSLYVQSVKKIFILCRYGRGQSDFTLNICAFTSTTFFTTAVYLQFVLLPIMYHLYEIGVIFLNYFVSLAGMNVFMAKEENSIEIFFQHLTHACRIVGQWGWKGHLTVFFTNPNVYITQSLKRHGSWCILQTYTTHAQVGVSRHYTRSPRNMKHDEKFNFTQSRHQTSCSKRSFSFRTQNIYGYAMAQGQVISPHPQTRCVEMVAFEWVNDIGETSLYACQYLKLNIRHLSFSRSFCVY